jgi:molecular chaperone Hsp33
MTLTPHTTEVESYLVRRRDALAVYGDFRPLLRDLELHSLAWELHYDPLVLQLLADGLTALGLHLASLPPNQFVGWTVSIQEPPVNLFFAGDSGSGAVVGRAFLEGVEPRPENLFVAQLKSPDSEPRRSTVPVDGIDIYGMVEHYYTRSEQRLARFLHDGPRAVLILALPQADAAWIRSLAPEAAFQLPREREVKLLARRHLTWRCGCDREKLANVLVGAYGSAPEALFKEEERVEVECPRCGALLAVSRDEYERVWRARLDLE